MTALQLGWWKYGIDTRSIARRSGGGTRTRCFVERHWSFVHVAIRSPMLTTNVPSITGTSTQPSLRRSRTSSPPVPSW